MNNMMKIYHSFNDASAAIKTLSAQTIVTVGAFDGVHKGHRRLIYEMNQIAKSREITPIVITFWPHPKHVLKGHAKLLSTIDEKIYLLMEAGAKNIIIVDFTQKFCQISHDDFINEYLIGKLNAKAIVLSDDHHFGRNRQGSNSTIKTENIETILLPRYENISSSAVREAIENGDMKTAHQLLGEPYLIAQPVTNPTKIIPQEIDKKHMRYIKITTF